MKGIHTEETFEAFIAGHLVDHGGYEFGSPTAYDREKALIPGIVVEFVKATQQKAWEKLVGIHKDALEPKFIASLCEVMDKRGALDVLRHGFKFFGEQIRLAYFQPGNDLNPAVWELYKQNRLTVVRQLKYDLHNENELDLVLFLNGLPIVTAELKNQTSGQNVSHGKKQYREHRDRKAPLFRWKQRALVHFVLDTDEAWMTTRLMGVDTHFLPFNRGHDHGAGNPPVKEKHRTFYVWEEVWQRDSLLDLVNRFIHLQVEERTEPNTGKKTTTETVIFPRYHQLDCVRRLVGAARTYGAGRNYLVQHSAGSGKSNSIAWLAHRLASLHDENDKKVYDSVVVLTDRRVLDQQLQATIYQFEHKTGVVERIDKHSDQLAKALASGTPIIISTIHKFGFIQDKVQGLPDRRYAIIVDEAHSSQSGEMAVTVKELLADSSVAEKLAQESDDLAVPDQLALRAALFRGPQPNMSFFAFTATPKHKTLELFGHKGADGKPAPFHLYSMRQAIEEEFILDVLKGYITRDRHYTLAKKIASDPSLDKSKAASALARFVDLHPTNIAQKTQIIVEHFRSCVMHLLGGRAKAMVVTAGRLQAVRYKQAFDDYLVKNGYKDVRCLVAFSGEVQDDKVPTITYTEPGLNKGITETELPDKFASDAFNVLLVANKYQTGFDQPLLVAMYVDKRLDGVQAVQTLSRLNRTCRGKESTFVLDFVNKREDILKAFQTYFEWTTTEDEVDPQRLYELQHALEGFQVFTASEVNGFAEVFFALKSDQKITDNPKLNGWLDPAVHRFKDIKTKAEQVERDDERDKAVADAVAKQDDFRAKLHAFKNLYGFLGQLVPFHDLELEKLYAYGRLLLRKLPRRDTEGPLDLGDDVALASFKLHQEVVKAITLVKGKGGTVTGPDDTGTGSGKGPKEKLSTIIELINKRFGTEFDAQDLVDGVADQLAADDGLQQAAKVNDKGNFGHVFKPALEDALMDRHAKHTDFINKVFGDEALGEFFRALMLDRVYEALRKPAGGEVLPFKRLYQPEAKPYVNCVPVYFDLAAAAGAFGASLQVEEPFLHPDGDQAPHVGWAALSGGRKPTRDLFVARVVGESLNRRVPNGSWCLWQLKPELKGDGTDVVLAELPESQDSEMGSFTAKVYVVGKEADSEGMMRVARVRLKPDSDQAGFEEIVVGNGGTADVKIVAKMLEVLVATEDLAK
jgi:type I restriction enzyme R subunit